MDRRAEATAEYLEEVQWNNENDIPTKINPTKIFTKDLNIVIEDFTVEELNHVLKKLKNNKAAGPDQTVT